MRVKLADEMRQKNRKKKTIHICTDGNLGGVRGTCFIANHIISAKSHLIEWVGSF